MNLPISSVFQKAQSTSNLKNYKQNKHHRKCTTIDTDPATRTRLKFFLNTLLRRSSKEKNKRRKKR